MKFAGVPAEVKLGEDHPSVSFAADWGFVTLTMSISSLVAGVLADRFGATTATISTASLSVLWALFWGAWTWRLWR